MFRRKKPEGEDDVKVAVKGPDIPPESMVAPAAKPIAQPSQSGVSPMSVSPSGTQSVPPPSLPNRVPTMPPRPTAELPRPADPPRRPSELVAPSAAPPRDSGVRQLIVGREISLSGEIRACDRVVVEGSVEANLTDCHDMEIAEAGLFKGSAAIDEADIRGRFEGTLTVRGRLFIRSTGKVTGTVRYGQIDRKSVV